MRARKVEDIMSTQLVTLTEEDTLDLASFEMDAARFRHLPIVERGRPGRLVGIVTHRDILRVAGRALAEPTAEGRDRMLRQVAVREVMCREVETARTDEAAAHVARRLVGRKIGCLPVLDERGTLVGIVTESDFVRLAAELLEQRGPVREDAAG